MSAEKRRFGDRKDGKLLRDLDSLHFITPILYPNRCDNEAYISEKIDLTNINAWLKNHNETDTEYPYKLFQVIVTAVLKILTLRPKMNRFIVNGDTFQRNEVSASFVVKKVFSDKGEEALAVVRTNGTETIFDIHNLIKSQVMTCRSDKPDSSTESMNLFNKLPRWISKTAVKFICLLDKHGKVPSSLIESDPYYTSVVLSNIGSLKLKCGYHHLVNWGTNSVFVLIGETKTSPVFEEDGSYTMRPTVELGLTVDERIADGYYYSKTVKLLKYLLENPEYLEKPLNEEVEIK